MEHYHERQAEHAMRPNAEHIDERDVIVPRAQGAAGGDCDSLGNQFDLRVDRGHRVSQRRPLEYRQSREIPCLKRVLTAANVARSRVVGGVIRHLLAGDTGYARAEERDRRQAAR